jgi:M6 family metalloprotease-like protein
MHSLRPLLVFANIIALLGLCGCSFAFPQGGSSISSSSRSASENTSTSQEKSLSLSLAKNTMSYGGEFLTACQPSLLYRNGKVKKTLSIADASLSASIWQGETVYELGDLLPQGHYTVSVSYPFAKVSASADFDVLASDPIAASEGHGYKTISNLADYRLEALPNYACLGPKPLKSIGSQKILVIPVTFKGNAAFTSAELATVNKAYNGEANETGWQSLHSFYATSSYNKLDLSATITTPFEYSQTDSEFETTANALGTNYSNAVNTIAEAAIDSLEKSSFDFTPFDSDSNGYIDGLELVYKTTKNNTKNGGAQVWWNFTTVDSDSQSTASKVSYYFWSEYSALSNGYYTPDIDDHVLIHESGHMLGLCDYYSYDKNECPAGGSDMMDHNIGDHNAYSKMLLGWCNPKIIDGSASDFTLDLAPFEEKGEAILLRNTTSDPFNGTPYDEYLLLQYYTPTSLNLKDASGYKEWWPHGTYSQAGLQVFHVDSRLCQANTNGYVYTDNVSSSAFVAASNTGSYSLNVEQSAKNAPVYQSPYRLLKALPASGNDLFKTAEGIQQMGSNAILFGDSTSEVGGSFYSNYRMRNLFPNGLLFNDGSSLNYSFSVNTETSEKISLHFVKNA